MRAAVNALLATGNNVNLDEMPIDDLIVPAWRRDLRATSRLWVQLTASLPVLQAARTRPYQPGNWATPEATSMLLWVTAGISYSTQITSHPPSQRPAF